MNQRSEPFYVMAILPKLDADGSFLMRDVETDDPNEDIKIIDPEEDEEKEQENVMEELICELLHFGSHTSIEFNVDVGYYPNTETVAWIRVEEDNRILMINPLELRAAETAHKT